MVPNHATRVRFPAGALTFTPQASMAEWSKALDLSSSIRKNAQVRTLLEADHASVAQLAARRIHSPKVEGSTPSGGTFLVVGGDLTSMSSWPNG